MDSLVEADCRALDASDPLAPLRDQFVLPHDIIYLDGNSLGALPRSTQSRLTEVVRREWGDGLIGSWNTAGWIDSPHRVGDKIARLIGARPGEVVATDSTSVNLYKGLGAALAIQAARAPDRRVIVSEGGNFPTDLYITRSLARDRSMHLRLSAADELDRALDDRVAVLVLTHVDYRTGAMHDMAAVTARAHAAGALVIWDLAHSAGAVPVDLHAAQADIAIGCGYKYLNGGPGAPAFIWVHPRHLDRFAQPLTGWMGHRAPFEFAPDYQPAAGIDAALCGTPPILAMAALECGVDSVLAAEPFGGMSALRKKSVALTELFIRLVDERCAGLDLALISPRAGALRGSQVSISHPSGGFPIMQALIERGVIGDFRAGGAVGGHDILRFGLTPLYTRYIDLWHAVDHLRDVLANGLWRAPRYSRHSHHSQRNKVT